ncbi:MAG: hypothetical protein HYT87_12855 [Nitrospirae bacterium]|nr:hypothetical protein [Nitrospirota bacterium]
MLTGTVLAVEGQVTAGSVKQQDILLRDEKGTKRRLRLVGTKAFGKTLEGQTIKADGFKVVEGRILMGPGGKLTLIHGGKDSVGASAKPEQPKAPEAPRRSPLEKAFEVMDTCTEEARKLLGEMQVTTGTLVSMGITMAIYAFKHRSSGRTAQELMKESLDRAKTLAAKYSLCDDDVVKLADSAFVTVTRNPG